VTIKRPGGEPGAALTTELMRLPKTPLVKTSVRNRQDQDEDVTRALVGRDASQELRPRHPGQVENEQDQLRPHLLPPGIPAGAEQVIQPGLSVTNDLDWIRQPRPPEGARRLGRRPHVVLHQQNVSHLIRHQFRVDARFGSRPHGAIREQVPNGDLQRPRQIRDRPERDVALAPLDVCKVGAVDAGPPC
jgi:hypothetical protein